MKRSGVVLAVVLLAGALAGQDRTPLKVVRVVGTAEVRVVPDRAVIELGVQKQDANAGAAKRAADAASRKILAALRGNGVDEKDVQTAYLSLQPQSYTSKGVKHSFFLAQQTLSVTVRDLGKLDKLLEAIIQAGGNQIDSIAYETSELRKYRDQAREMAVKAAREKAVALAQALGQEVGKAHAIEEVPEPSYGGTLGMLQNSYVAVDSRSRGGESSLAAGQKTVSASVVVSFDLN